jgi:hypothetical protein
LDILYTILSIVLTILGWVFAILWWFLSFLFMPLLILAVLAAFALRIAWRTPMTKPFVERMFARLQEKGYGGVKRLLYLLTVEPFRVIFRFIGFSMLYAWVNLWWKPKWSPWTRARENPKNKKA